jgi:hypothetical protein
VTPYGDVLGYLKFQIVVLWVVTSFSDVIEDTSVSEDHVIPIFRAHFTKKGEVNKLRYYITRHFVIYTGHLVMLG